MEYLNPEFQEYLSDIPLDGLHWTWFHQDWASPRNTRAVSKFLNGKLKNLPKDGLKMVVSSSYFIQNDQRAHPTFPC